MLVQKVVSQYDHKVTFKSENFGESKLAEKFGVKRYPAVFVNEVLVARPRDFGFIGQGETAGRYAPWKDAKNQQRFALDLKKMVDLALVGKAGETISAMEPADQSGELKHLPRFTITDLSGRTLSTEDLNDRIVIVEFWATWCPPCRSTLEWLGKLQEQYGENVAIIALAVESPQDQVRTTTAALSQQIHWAVADSKTATILGDVSAVPTMLVFNKKGEAAEEFYGAPPDLHEKVGKLMRTLQSPQDSAK